MELLQNEERNENAAAHVRSRMNHNRKKKEADAAAVTTNRLAAPTVENDRIPPREFNEVWERAFAHDTHGRTDEDSALSVSIANRRLVAQ
jgi:hypothetical protein